MNHLVCLLSNFIQFILLFLLYSLELLLRHKHSLSLRQVGCPVLNHWLRMLFLWRLLEVLGSHEIAEVVLEHCDVVVVDHAFLLVVALANIEFMIEFSGLFIIVGNWLRFYLSEGIFQPDSELAEVRVVLAMQLERLKLHCVPELLHCGPFMATLVGSPVKVLIVILIFSV